MNGDPSNSIKGRIAKMLCESLNTRYDDSIITSGDISWPPKVDDGETRSRAS